MSQFVNAVQSGDEILVVNAYGSVIRRYNGILISFSDGKLVYKSGSSTISTMVV